MTYNSNDRLRFPIIPTAAILAGTATGSCSGDQIETLTEMRDWLAWRVEDGWVERGVPMAARYDLAVRAMARAALAMYDQETKGHPDPGQDEANILRAERDALRADLTELQDAVWSYLGIHDSNGAWSDLGDAVDRLRDCVGG